MANDKQELARLWAENDARLGGEFVSLRLGGCKADADGVDGLQSEADAEFFTVYGVDADGIAQAIRDADTLADGETELLRLSRVLGIPSDRCRFL